MVFIRWTGHAQSLKVLATLTRRLIMKHVRLCAVGRALAMCRLLAHGQVGKLLKKLKAKLNNLRFTEHEITLKVAVDYISAALHVAIIEDDEEGILEVLKVCMAIKLDVKKLMKL